MSSCGYQKYLTESETLYTGADINYKKNGSSKFPYAVKVELEDVIYPDPNLLLFGIFRPKLWIYNTTKEPKKEKGFRYWKKYKLGYEPVLLEETNPKRIKNLLLNRLYNHGYFNAKANYTINYKKKEAHVIYNLELNQPYLIDSISFPEAKDSLSIQIAATKSKTLIKKGSPYDLSVLKEERVRISERMNNLGYYYFDPNFLIFEIDSTVGDKRVNIFLRVKKNIKENFLELKRLGNIYVFPNYDLRNSDTIQHLDTLLSNGTNYILQDSSIRPKIVTDVIYLEKDKKYSKKAHEYTINRLVGLGVYQFVSIKYIPDSTTNKLYPHVQLTPSIKKSIRLELSGTTKSNGFTGPNLQLSFRDKNLFKGAELLSINLNFGYEVQLLSDASGLNSYEFGINTQLRIPRIISPFNIKLAENRFTPTSNIRLGFKSLNRQQYYQLNSFDVGFGYKWRTTLAKLHEFYPVSINYVNLVSSSPEFDEILLENPSVRRSFEEQFILGTNYYYTFDSRLKRASQHNFYFKGGIDLSGNFAQLFKTLDDDKKSFGDDSDYKLLGISFSQYLRLESVFKYFFYFKNDNVIANRLILGSGISYGNSFIMPYIKQFFIGGVNSIRAFQARSLGPGTYRRTEEDLNGNIFIDQSGELKLEFNSEYRINIYSIYKAALFVDIGNVWLLREDSLRPGGEFKADQFLNELAVGVGVGLRIDPDFFVIRLDLGFPLRKPFLPKGERWVLDNFGTDPVLNIAIGYPF